MISEALQTFWSELAPHNARLVAVSKTKPVSDLLEAYNAGNKIFGENKVQELVEKYEVMPKDVEWHMIGHLQRNKVKYIAPFVALIHAVDSIRLLKEIDKQGAKNNRVIDCLLQVHIADEEAKFGFDAHELKAAVTDPELKEMKNIRIIGLMGMATFTDDTNQIRNEFRGLRNLFDEIKDTNLPENIHMQELSMGMSGDYKIALEEGSTMVRIGSSIFGLRSCQIDA